MAHQLPKLSELVEREVFTKENGHPVVCVLELSKDCSYSSFHGMDVSKTFLDPKETKR